MTYAVNFAVLILNKLDMKTKCILLALALSIGLFVTSCSDNNGGETLAPLVGKWNITKVGTIAGCYVMDGKVMRNTKIRVIRDGIVVFTGGLGSLKRFKDDVKEVTANYECGLNIDGYNDIKVDDIIEGYDMVEIKAKL